VYFRDRLAWPAGRLIIGSVRSSGSNRLR